jgi:hypothetical protein
MRAFAVRAAAIAGSLALVAATGAASPVGPASAATQAPILRWKLAPDLRAHPNLNPFPNYLGGAAMWSLRASASTKRNGFYKLLRAYSPTFGSPGIKAWHGTTPSCVELPAMGVNTTDKPLPLCTGNVPGDAAFVTPTAKRMPVVAWTSYFDGAVSISHDAIADVDASCGDGITYYVYLGASQLSRVRIANQGAVTLPSMSFGIAKGQSLYFIVTPGPSGDAACDTTQLQITIDRV